MEHLPVTVTAAALSDSVLELLDEEPAPAQTPSGYDIWKDASERSTSGMFTLTVDRVLEDLEEIFKGL